MSFLNMYRSKRTPPPLPPAFLFWIRIIYCGPDHEFSFRRKYTHCQTTVEFRAELLTNNDAYFVYEYFRGLRINKIVNSFSKLDISIKKPIANLHQILHNCNCQVSTQERYLLCRYRKRTDIYYSTWSFENVTKNCQFQFLDPLPKIASFSF